MKSVTKIFSIVTIFLVFLLFSYNPIKSSASEYYPLQFPTNELREIYVAGQNQGRKDSFQNKKFSNTIPKELINKIVNNPSEDITYYKSIYQRGYKHGYFITKQGYAYYKEGYELGFQLLKKEDIRNHTYYTKQAFKSGYQEGKDAKLDVLAPVCEKPSSKNINNNFKADCNSYWDAKKYEAGLQGYNDAVSMYEPDKEIFENKKINHAYLLGFYKNEERSKIILQGIVNGLVSFHSPFPSDNLPLDNTENNLYLHYFQLGQFFKIEIYMVIATILLTLFLKKKREPALKA